MQNSNCNVWQSGGYVAAISAAAAGANACGLINNPYLFLCRCLIFLQIKPASQGHFWFKE